MLLKDLYDNHKINFNFWLQKYCQRIQEWTLWSHYYKLEIHLATFVISQTEYHRIWKVVPTAFCINNVTVHLFLMKRLSKYTTSNFALIMQNTFPNKLKDI